MKLLEGFDLEALTNYLDNRTVVDDKGNRVKVSAIEFIKQINPNDMGLIIDMVRLGNKDKITNAEAAEKLVEYFNEDDDNDIITACHEIGLVYSVCVGLPKPMRVKLAQAKKDYLKNRDNTLSEALDKPVENENTQGVN